MSAHDWKPGDPIYIGGTALIGMNGRRAKYVRIVDQLGQPIPHALVQAWHGNPDGTPRHGRRPYWLGGVLMRVRFAIARIGAKL